MSKRKWHWEVEVPAEGPLTREQAWSALSSLFTKIDLIGYRITSDEAKELPALEAVLEDEIGALRAVQRHCSKLLKDLEQGVLDKLASIKSDEPEDEDERFPKDLKDVFDNYYGDVARWERRAPNNSKVVLALAMLDDSGVDVDGIREFITKELDPRSNYSDVWDCPQCDDHNTGMIGEAKCRRCYGWGYVFGDKPNADQYDWSERGRATLNSGEPWTREQEGAEQDRLKKECEEAYAQGYHQGQED